MVTINVAQLATDFALAPRDNVRVDRMQSKLLTWWLLNIVVS